MVQIGGAHGRTFFVNINHQMQWHLEVSTLCWYKDIVMFAGALFLGAIRTHCFNWLRSLDDELLGLCS